ncbi:MAG: NAD(P)H-hydrate dehydratase [Candidatus Omnitrophota bacterium]|jgi:NAD(P)H-hydrate epimerase
MNLAPEIRKSWKRRARAAHKGDFGRVLILAGSKGYAGAAHLAASACLRAGAGLVTLGVPEKIYTVLARREAEVMVKPFASTHEGTLSRRSLRAILDFARTQDVLAVGPGLSRQSETQALVRALIREVSLPVVLDADGLNALEGHPALLKKITGRFILTPHPGEFLRLFGGPLTGAPSVRKKRAAQAAKSCGGIVLLKGRGTVVAAPNGKTYVNTTGNPGMATGGSGDVLTGMIAALLGQGFSPWDAARFGAYLHGLAGDLAARKFGEISMTAGDLLTFLPQVIRKTLGF